MAEASDMSRRYYEEASRLASSYPEIAVDASAEEIRHKGEAIAVVLGHIKHGQTPKDAHAMARIKLRAVINWHNTMRPDDAGWQRDLDYMDNTIESVVQAIEKAAQGAAIP